MEEIKKGRRLRSEKKRSHDNLQIRVSIYLYKHPNVLRDHLVTLLNTNLWEVEGILEPMKKNKWIKTEPVGKTYFINLTTRGKQAVKDVFELKQNQNHPLADLEAFRGIELDI